METAAETQQRLVADFAEFSDAPFSLYEYLLGFSAELPVMPDGERELAALVEGCQSRVWLRVIRGHTGRLTIALDSDTLIVRGVLNAIVQIYSNRARRSVLGRTAKRDQSRHGRHPKRRVPRYLVSSSTIVMSRCWELMPSLR